MLKFGSGLSTASSAASAARAAAIQAQTALGDGTPKIAILFASKSYSDLADAPAAVREVLGPLPIVGGTSGACLLGPESIATHGVSLVVLGGDDIEVALASADLRSPELVDVVPAASQIARAADDAAKAGLMHYACLVFAPGIHVDGDALVAAVRKGAGARAQLAGCLTGDDLTRQEPEVFVADELRHDRVVLAGLFTRKHVGIAARHGWTAIGPSHTVTRANGPVLVELDRRPARDVWLEDIRRDGGVPPTNERELAVYLANYYELGLVVGNGHGGDELVARAPWVIGPDGSITLSASIGEGQKVHVVHASRKDLLRASTDAAAAAVMRAGSQVAGALVLACTGRIAALGEEFADEPERIRRRLAAPIGGACVYGEIARNERDVDAFHNTTAVIVAFAA
jgi:hypothetical protein